MKRKATSRMTAVLTSLLVALGLLVAVAPDALATTLYCNTSNPPVGISVYRVNQYAIHVSTWAPLNGTAHVIVDGYDVGQVFVSVGHTSSLQVGANNNTSHLVWVRHYGASGQVWVGSYGQTLGWCSSLAVRVY